MQILLFMVPPVFFISALKIAVRRGTQPPQPETCPNYTTTGNKNIQTSSCFGLALDIIEIVNTV